MNRDQIDSWENNITLIWNQTAKEGNDFADYVTWCSGGILGSVMVTLFSAGFG